MKLAKRIKNKEFVLYPTDKSGRWSVVSAELYRQAAIEHIANDREVDWSVIEKTEAAINKHMAAILLAFKAGSAHNHEARVKSAFKSQDNLPAPVYFLVKDHKRVPFGWQMPPTRPVCGAINSPNTRMSAFLSRLLNYVADEAGQGKSSTPVPQAASL